MLVIKIGGEVMRIGMSSGGGFGGTLNYDLDNDGRRLKDHGEMRKGVAACRELTIQRGYCWGEHKSMSQCRSERPYERERQSMCRDIYRLHASGLRPFPACLGTSGIRGGRGVASRESGSRVY